MSIDAWRDLMLKAAKLAYQAEVKRIEAQCALGGVSAAAGTAIAATDPADPVYCEECGDEIKPSPGRNGRGTFTAAQKADWSRKKFGSVLCYNCAKTT